MADFTHEEIERFKKNGNKEAKRKWLYNFQISYPIPNNVIYISNFIKDVFVNKTWYHSEEPIKLHSSTNSSFKLTLPKSPSHSRLMNTNDVVVNILDAPMESPTISLKQTETKSQPISEIRSSPNLLDSDAKKSTPNNPNYDKSFRCSSLGLDEIYDVLGMKSTSVDN